MQPEKETEAAAAAAAVSAVRRQELAASGTLKAATPTPQDKAQEMIEKNDIHTGNKRKQKQALSGDDGTGATVAATAALPACNDEGAEPYVVQSTNGSSGYQGVERLQNPDPKRVR